MTKTILITGSSSGIGRATAFYFAERGWNVAATMRSPEKQNDFAQSPKIKIYRLDVTDTASIDVAISNAVQNFGQVDILLNNAGFSVFGAFECASEQEIQSQLNTNLLGVMNVTRAVLPHFRQRREGRIITITSIGGLAAFPLFTLYHATKWAVEGFMESLHYELKPFNIKVKIVEPGAVDTQFTANTIESNSSPLKEYDAFVEKVKQSLLSGNPNRYDRPLDIAKAVMQAATDQGTRMRYPVGNANIIVLLRKLLPLSWFQGLVSRSNGL
jgi:NAD(P)-dependent dehydrogenase (short-subunit alcohol dehydrogenase family)